MCEGHSLGNYAVGKKLVEFSEGAVGTWFHARGAAAGTGPEDLFVQTIEKGDVVRADFTPGEGEAWERLTEFEGRPMGFSRMLDTHSDWMGKYWTFAYEYKIWDDPDHPCGWLSTLLDQPRDEDPRISLGSFLSLATTLWKVLEHLHAHDLVHMNIRPSSVLYMRVGGERLKFAFYNAGFGVARAAIPENELEYYEEKDLPHQGRIMVCESGYAAYDKSSDLHAATRLLQNVIERVEEAELEYEQIMQEIERDLAIQHGDAGPVIEATKEQIVLNIENLTRAARGATIPEGHSPEAHAHNVLREYERIFDARHRLKRQITEGQVADDLVLNLLRDLIERGTIGLPDAEYEALVPIADGEEAGPPQAIDRGEGRENTDRFELEIRGRNLRTSVLFDLELVATPWDEVEGEGPARERFRLTRLENRTDTRGALRREAPSLGPGTYRLLARKGEEADPVDTGLALEVLESEGPTWFEAVEPEVIEDCSRPATLTITGKRLRQAGGLRIGPGTVIGSLMESGEAVDIVPVEGEEDRSRRIVRMTPALAAPGVYFLLEDGKSTGLSVEIRRREHEFHDVEPRVVENDRRFECVVRGNYLIAGLEYTLVDREGFDAQRIGSDAPFTLEVVEETPEAVRLEGPEGLRLGEYEVHCDGASTGLGLKSVCRVTSLAPPRLATRGRRQEITVAGGIFDKEADHSLKNRQTGEEVPLGAPAAGHEREIRFAQPDGLRPGVSELLIAGEPTGAEVRVTRLPRPVLVGGAIGAVVAILALLFLLSSYVAAPGYDEVVVAGEPDALYLYRPATGGPVHVFPHAALHVEGGAMEEVRAALIGVPGGNTGYAELPRTASEPTGGLVSLARGILGIVGAGGEGDRYGSFEFGTLEELDASTPDSIREGAEVVLRTGDEDPGTWPRVTDGLPPFVPFSVEPGFEIAGFETRRPATTREEVAEFRLPKDGVGSDSIDVTIRGTGLGLVELPDFSVTVQTGGREIPATLVSATDSAATVRVGGLEFGGTNVLYVKPADPRLPPTLVGRFTLRRRQSFEGIALAADGPVANRVQAYYGEKLYLKSGTGTGNGKFRLVAEGAPPIPAAARARGNGWLEISPAPPSGIGPAGRRQATANYRVMFEKDGVEEDTDCSAALHPRPVWIGWDAVPPDRLSVEVSADGAIDVLPKLYLENRGTVGAIGLKPAGANGEIVEITPSPGVEGDREYVGLDLTGKGPRLLAGGQTSADFAVLARSNLPGRTEWAPVALADGTAVGLTMQNAAGRARLEELVTGADAAFASGSADDLLGDVDESLGTDYEAVWSDAATRDRIGFYKWFVNRYYRGVWRGAADPPAPKTAAFQAAVRMLEEIEWRNFPRQPDRVEPPDFSASTPSEADDWISSFIAGYDAWLQLSYHHKHYGKDDREALVKRALDNLREAAKSEKILSPFLLLELEGGLFQMPLGNAAEVVGDRLQRMSARGGAYGATLKRYFTARAKGRDVIEKGGPDPAVGETIVETARALATSCPERAAELGWSFVDNKEVFPAGDPGGQLKAVFEQVREKLLPQVAEYLKDRFE